MSRLDDLAANLATVEDRIAAACASAGRSRDEITLIVITKTYPASDVALLHELGVEDIGENRHPEAGHKKAELGPVADEIRWHFVGGLQSNKASAVAGYADAVHSVDRSALVARLSSGAVRRERDIDCFVQVNLEGAGSTSRAGCPADQVPDLATEIDAADGLRLRGLMAVAPLGADPAPAFAELAALSASLVREHPAATAISAGMSGDLEAAITHGATHVRIGRSVLGERPPLG